MLEPGGIGSGERDFSPTVFVCLAVWLCTIGIRLPKVFSLLPGIYVVLGAVSGVNTTVLLSSQPIQRLVHLPLARYREKFLCN